jgi:hypothetical protein
MNEDLKRYLKAMANYIKGQEQWQTFKESLLESYEFSIEEIEELEKECSK